MSTLNLELLTANSVYQCAPLAPVFLKKYTLHVNTLAVYNKDSGLLNSNMYFSIDTVPEAEVFLRHICHTRWNQRKYTCQRGEKMSWRHEVGERTRTRKRIGHPTPPKCLSSDAVILELNLLLECLTNHDNVV